MASDRRKSSRRPSADPANDRRKSGDRRSNPDTRRASDQKDDGKVFERVKSPKKTSGRSAAKPASAVGRSFVKTLAAVLILVMTAVCIAAVLLFANLEYVVSRLGEAIDVSVERVAVDTSGLTGKETKTQITFLFKNSLPVRVVVQKIICSLDLGEYNLVKNAVFAPCYVIEGCKNLGVPVVCSTDSIAVRRALQKGIADKTSNRKQGELSISRKEIASGNLKSICNVVGQVEYRLKFCGIEIPFKKTFD